MRGVNPQTGYRFYFDGLFAKYNLIVEVHGKQHSKFVPYFHHTEDQFRDIQYRDKLKRGLALNQGLKYLVILHDEPFRTRGYLAGRIHDNGESGRLSRRKVAKKGVADGADCGESNPTSRGRLGYNT